MNPTQTTANASSGREFAVGELKIDSSEQFQLLPKAPIVEAVIEVRGRAEAAWEEKAVQAYFVERLNNYKFLDSQRQFEQQFELKKGQPPAQRVTDLGFRGVRFQSTDERHVVQLNKDGFVFSRLKPYEHWQQLQSEALRIWAIYSELAKPAAIHRLGVRFINRIQLPVGVVPLEDYIQPSPEMPKHLEQLQFLGFLHHNTLAVPGHPYAINLIQTIQPPQNAQIEGFALILDIDVFTTPAAQVTPESMPPRLAEMRWLKNKVFFGSVTAKAIETFK